MRADSALSFDVEAAKSIGFDMLRKHGKLEPARWYYHCDRLGMLVWQDMPSPPARTCISAADGESAWQKIQRDPDDDEEEEDNRRNCPLDQAMLVECLDE